MICKKCGIDKDVTEFSEVQHKYVPPYINATPIIYCYLRTTCDECQRKAQKERDKKRNTKEYVKKKRAEDYARRNGIPLWDRI